MLSWLNRFLQTGKPLSGAKAKEFNIVDRFTQPDGDDAQLVRDAVAVLTEDYFFTKGVKLGKKIKCAASARLNGRLEILENAKLVRSGKKKMGGNAYVGLKGMTNKKKKPSKL